MAKRKFSPAQIAAQQRFTEMAKARAKGAARAVGRPIVGGSGGGFVDFLLMGAIAALWVTGGKLASRFVPNLLKIDGTTPTGFAIGSGAQLAAGAAGAWALDTFWNRAAGQLFFAGAVQAVLESGIRRMEVPILAPLLGDEGDALMGYTYELQESPFNPAMALAAGYGPMGTYPRGLGSYVQQ